MRIPPNAVIPTEKLTHYLLVFRPRNDKSGFLAQAGFFRQNAALLERGIRDLTAQNEAVPDSRNEYGTLYRVVGQLQGPLG